MAPTATGATRSKKRGCGEDEKMPNTPPKRKVRSTTRLVTPSAETIRSNRGNEGSDVVSARRSLNMPPVRAVSDSSSNSADESDGLSAVSHEERKGAFGRDALPPNVKQVYTIVNKLTGSIGGNGHGGAIYGELTAGSMQKMVNLMKEHTSLGHSSRFIDVGCGLAKPSLHVAQDPGVEFSYGIEMEHVRWMLGMSNLNQVLRQAEKQRNCPSTATAEASTIGYRCILAHGDVTDASFFDPFTHVYMFSIGFPPTLFHQLSDIFNRSKSIYLICYHGPRLIIDVYEFDVELITQTPTSMHGSSENHMGYLYRRRGTSIDSETSCSSGGPGLPLDIPCDPLFAEPWRLARSNLSLLSEHVAKVVQEHYGAGRQRRTRGGGMKKFA